MTDTIDLAIEYFQKRRRVLEDEILRRQMALQEVEAFLDAAQDGRSSLSRERKARDAKRGNSQEQPGDAMSAQISGEAPAP